MDRANALNMSSTSNMQPKMSSLFKLAYMLLFVLAPLGLTTIPVVLLFIDALVRRQTWPRGRLGFFGACLGLLLALLAASAVFSPRPLVAAATTSVFALVVGAVILPVHASMYATGTAGRQESAPARHLTAPPALAITKQHVLTLCFWLTTLAKRGLQSSGAILLDRRQGLPRLGQKNSILRALRSDRYYTADWHVNCSPGSLCSPLLHSGVVR